ncbi:sigma-70 family RNA polymerase sigma factor [Prauserella endophytica]|uniref:Sigma-70 family RNA polymerase sigma factor n=1 Tax=Prauserella endophytica TaxID=1592324 RepID=A0ABY2RV60_9PSEU|nr:sigma-70 family RNA polymerase sigma factor [Prauserella endophytica]TKG60964.1 sigma-70 family RNA polymerase sigma factor [Prauserella endophytica]
MDLSLPETDPESGVFSLRRNDEYARDDGVFDAAIATFGWLVTGPHPVCVDGASILGLPSRPVPLDELGALLLTEGCTQATRDAAWTYLITRARAQGGTWTMACVGLAMPVLLPVAAQLTNRFRGDKHDIHAAVLTGFLDGLAEVDLDRPAILVRLRWAAYRAGYTALREALDAAPPIEDIGFRSTPPHRPGGHPDLVLVTAVRAGVITTDEAALISATRFGELSLTEAAHARGEPYKTTQKVRHRAEQRLARYLTEPVDDSADDASAPASGTGGRGHTSGARHPAVRLSRTHRLRLRSVTRVSPELAKKFVRPVSPNGPKSGVSARGTRLPARPRRRPSPGPARRSALTQEARSCD